MYKRILVAIDGSATSLRGLNEAIRVAKATQGTLLLVHVVNEFVAIGEFAVPVNYDKVIASLREGGIEVLDEAVAIARRAEVPFEKKLVETLGGHPADEIVKEAKAWSADLIALGTHGRRGLKRFALGSDAELVVRQSPVPVLLIRDQPEAAR
jgi:nucleotide-binding universal stress UspA family protein